MMIKTRSRIHRLLKLFLSLSTRMRHLQALNPVQKEKGGPANEESFLVLIKDSIRRRWRAGSVY